jgi:hypothetical protein
MEPYDPKTSLYYYGPFLVGWHANQDSPGGAVGMFNALLTEVKLTDGSYLSVFESAKRGQLLYRTGVRYPVRPEFMIIVENSERIEWCEQHVKHNLYVGAIKKLIDNGVIPNVDKCSVIPKTNELLLKDKERIIISGGELFVSWYGKEASVLNKRFKDTFSLDNWMCFPMVSMGYKVNFTWGSGTTPEQRGQWFDLAMTVPPGCAAITVCGDDFASVVNIKGITFAVESDASNWDHSQVLVEQSDGTHHGILNVQYEYYAKLGSSDAFIQGLRNAGKSSLTWQSERKGQSLVAELNYSRRMSGLPDTTDGNTIVMADMMGNILLEMIDTFTRSVNDISFEAVQDYTVALGVKYGVKLKVKAHQDPRHMTFLKGFYVDACVGGKRSTIWYPSPEILVKLGTSESNPDNNPAYKKVQSAHRLVPNLARWLRVYDILNSWKTFKGMPLLEALIEMVGTPIKGITYEDSRARIQDMDKWDKPELTIEVTDQDFSPMLEVLGITDHVESFERFCRTIQWTPGMFVTHPIIAILALRYT